MTTLASLVITEVRFLAAAPLLITGRTLLDLGYAIYGRRLLP